MYTKCQKTCFSLFFTILTLVTVGSTIFLFSFAVHYTTKKIDVSKSISNGVIIALIVSIVVFIFAAIASFTSYRCLRGTLGLIFILYALFVLVMAIVLLAFKGKMLNLVGDAFETNNSDVIDSIEKGFDCKGWNRTVGVKDNCYYKVSDFWDKKGKVIAYVLIVVFVILALGVVLSFIFACHKNTEDELSSTSNTQFNTPLTYGW